MKINENGFWMNETAEGHANDEGLRSMLINLFAELGIKSVLDLGCGPGFYLAGFKEAGYICDGFDGNPHTEQLTKGLAKVADLSKALVLDNQYDCVLSLEVGEHIPKDYTQIFLENVTSHTNKYVILSWAVPGQNGDGHVNCQTNEYVSGEMLKKGFNRLTFFEKVLRDSAKFFWFKNTLMVFKRI